MCFFFSFALLFCFYCFFLNTISTFFREINFLTFDLIRFSSFFYLIFCNPFRTVFSFRHSLLRLPYSLSVSVSFLLVIFLRLLLPSCFCFAFVRVSLFGLFLRGVGGGGGGDNFLSFVSLLLSLR